MPYELTRAFEFSAAHTLPESGEGHKCRAMHGHNYILEVVVRGEADPQTGWVVDFGEIKRAVAPILDQLDHQTLNEVPGLENATSELVARWIYERLSPVLPGLARVTVAETPAARCTYWSDE
ncbi:MAG: 6-carboxytetrahydropterin synthase QueD [Candidatus Eisenbacteria sp.]|nr:6-carboxytetrahydropterin synthase QueD [Candidatus Eisenbacteria bacterium]